MNERKILEEDLTWGGDGGARGPAQPHKLQNLLLRDTYAVLTRCLRKKNHQNMDDKISSMKMRINVINR